jgi:primosomal protein N' (replication factor Y)
MITKGIGTEKVEDEISLLFPSAKVGRLDLDSVSKKNAHEEIINKFQNRQIDILIGTQMISKGLDFNNVSVVGVVDADNLLNFPDFRAFEKAFQLLTQVSGRAGRGDEQGEVIIQTSQPSHKILNFVVNNNYSSFFNSEIVERFEFSYPPYYKLIKLTIKHKKQEILSLGADAFANELVKNIKGIVLGPEDALIGRVQNYYIKEILIKIEKGEALKHAKNIIYYCIDRVKSDFRFKYLDIIADVDTM